MATFKLGRLTHMSSVNVDVMCNQADEDKEVITDECAVTIASFFQSSGYTGAAFAALASGAEWEAESVMSNIFHTERNDVPALPADEAASAYLELKMLRQWVVSKLDCQWYLMCDNKASVMLPHPILGEVPTCTRCAEKDARLRSS